MTKFESGCELMDVTSLHRPDTGWRFVDAHGHEHRWYVVDALVDAATNGGIMGRPAESYDPSARYDVPSLVWVKTGEEYWEDDGEPHEVGYHACRDCGEQIEPRYTADDCTQYVPGCRWFRIDGREVTPEQFAHQKAIAVLAEPFRARVTEYEQNHTDCWYWTSDPPYLPPCKSCARCHEVSG